MPLAFRSCAAHLFQGRCCFRAAAHVLLCLLELGGRVILHLGHCQVAYADLLMVKSSPGTDMNALLDCMMTLRFRLPLFPWSPQRRLLFIRFHSRYLRADGHLSYNTRFQNPLSLGRYSSSGPMIAPLLKPTLKVPFYVSNFKLRIFPIAHYIKLVWTDSKDDRKSSTGSIEPSKLLSSFCFGFLNRFSLTHRSLSISFVAIVPYSVPLTDNFKP